MGKAFKIIVAVLALCVPFLVAGCMNSLSQQSPLTYTDNMDQELELADQVATTGSFHDNPFRLIGYMLYPVGVILEYAVIRPAYIIASSAPFDSGYTVEDAFFGDPQPIRASQ